MDTGCIPPTVNFFQYTSIFAPRFGECQTGKFWRVACAERKIGEASPIDDTGNVGYDQFTWMLGCELGLRIEWIFTQVTDQKIVRDEI